MCSVAWSADGSRIVLGGEPCLWVTDEHGVSPRRKLSELAAADRPGRTAPMSARRRTVPRSQRAVSVASPVARAPRLVSKQQQRASSYARAALLLVDRFAGGGASG